MTKRTPKPQSSIIYSGPSLIDGAPIVCVAIVTSGNQKTGDMVQTYIIRADMSPLEASKSGADFSICGNCKHRGTPTTNPDKKQAEGRTCYVNLGQGPTQVFKRLTSTGYPTATTAETQTIGRARMVRLGTYGDPAAVPATIWDQLLQDSAGHTGYTHQHSPAYSMYKAPIKQNAPDYQRMMYSADTAAEASTAHNAGLRTFRVIPIKDYTTHGQSALLKNEILCPASKEAEAARVSRHGSGQRVTCDQCKLCSGSAISAKSIAIVAHGPTKAGV